jgi:hypothetical protein
VLRLERHRDRRADHRSPLRSGQRRRCSAPGELVACTYWLVRARCCRLCPSKRPGRVVRTFRGWRFALTYRSVVAMPCQASLPGRGSCVGRGRGGGGCARRCSGGSRGRACCWCGGRCRRAPPSCARMRKSAGSRSSTRLATRSTTAPSSSPNYSAKGEQHDRLRSLNAVDLHPHHRARDSRPHPA